jgi:hypothetical protein
MRRERNKKTNGEKKGRGALHRNFSLDILEGTMVFSREIKPWLMWKGRPSSQWNPST